MEDKIIKVLLVEDNPGDARLIREMLAEVNATPYELMHATSLAQAFEFLKGAVDVVILDLNLPDSLGEETFLRVHSHAPGIPIVILTGIGDEALPLKALKRGIQDYLVKGQIDGRYLARSLVYAMERHNMLSVLKQLTMIDDLTGLYNRRSFFEFAEHHVKLATRSKRPLLLIMADVDGLKQINDTHGHQEGDLALIKTASLLKGTFRASDIVSRIGGDEFAMLVIEAGMDTLEDIAARLTRNLKELNLTTELPFTISLSMGTAMFDPGKPSTFKELLLQADKAMYQHKKQKEEQQSQHIKTKGDIEITLEHN
jgi:two-component system cell cycle response regulator